MYVAVGNSFVLTAVDFSGCNVERLFTQYEFKNLKRALAGNGENIRDELTDNFNKNMKKNFNLGFFITIDEGPLPTYANDMNRSFTPNKPYPNHVEHISLCDAVLIFSLNGRHCRSARGSCGILFGTREDTMRSTSGQRKCSN